MAFGWAGAATGASDALQELLARAFAQKQAAARMALQQQELGLHSREADRAAAADAERIREFNARQALEQEQFTADKTFKQQAVTRQEGLDRQAQNKLGVQRMMGDYLMQRGAQPIDQGARNQLTGMAISEGVTLPNAFMEDPTLEHRNRLEEIAAQGKNALAVANVRAADTGDKLIPVQTVENGQNVTKYLPASVVSGQTFARPDTGNTAQDRQREARVGAAREFLGRLNQLREKINTKMGPQAGITGLVRRGQANIGLDPDVAEYERIRAAGGRSLAVAIMGAQNLSDADAAAWANMLPGATVDRETAKRLTDQVEKMLTGMAGGAGVPPPMASHDQSQPGGSLMWDAATKQWK